MFSNSPLSISGYFTPSFHILYVACLLFPLFTLLIYLSSFLLFRNANRLDAFSFPSCIILSLPSHFLISTFLILSMSIKPEVYLRHFLLHTLSLFSLRHSGVLFPLLSPLHLSSSSHFLISPFLLCKGCLYLC